MLAGEGSDPLPGSAVTRQTPRSRVKQRAHRAAKACLSCRARKVRCDVVSRSPNPCTNCHLDQIECAVPTTKRLPNKTTVPTPPCVNNAIALDVELPTPSSPNNLKTPCFDLAEPSAGTSDNIIVQTVPLISGRDRLMHSPPSDSIDGALKPALESVTGSWTQDVSVSMHDLENEDALFFDFESLTQMFPDECHMQDDTTMCPNTRWSTGSELHRPELDSCHGDSKLHDYTSSLRWVANWRGPELNQTAQSTTMNTSLTPEAVESLLRDYFQFVNPTFPVVSEWDVYRLTHPDQIQSGERVPPMSLALFNAIMFAACASTTADIARAAGFHDIRSMREAFHATAKDLYETGCEPDPLNQIRICLLLSQRRKYPDGMFENERWATRAQQLLQQAERSPSVSKPGLPYGSASAWRVVSCCCIVRAQRVLIGTHRTGSIDPFQPKVPAITMADLDGDLCFPWFLDVATKQVLARMFVATVELHHLLDPLCQVVLHPNPKPESGKKGPGSFISVIGVVEEVESSLVEWRAQYNELILLDCEGTRDTDAASRSCLRVAAAYMNLGYEYCVSYLHQLSLDFERSTTTSWAARIRESSREALGISATSTTKILRDLLKHDAVKLLPFSAITMLFIPLTINSIYLKTSLQNSPRSVYDLSICFQALETLAQRHEIADFFWELNNASMMLVHKKVAEISISSNPKLFADSCGGAAILQPGEQEKIPLPQTEAYSTVLRFLRQSFVLGTVRWDLVIS